MERIKKRFNTKKLAEIGYRYGINFSLTGEVYAYQYQLMADWKDGSRITSSQYSWEEKAADK